MYLRVVPLDLLQADDDGEEFHPVVGGEGKAAGEFLLVASAPQDNPVAAGAGVPAGRAVRIKVDGCLFVHIMQR